VKREEGAPGSARVTDDVSGQGGAVTGAVRDLRHALPASARQTAGQQDAGWLEDDALLLNPEHDEE